MAGGKGSKGKKRPGGRRPPAASRAPTAKKAPPAVAPTGAGPRPRPTRAERLDAARQARKRKALLVRLGVAGAVALVVAAIAWSIVSDRRAEKAARDRLTAGSCTFDTRNDTLRPAPDNHVAPASYEVDPPSGGSHAPQAATAGIYGSDNPAPPDGQLVHSLEHGFVILWHRPDLGDDDLAAVRGVFDEHPDDVLVVPRPSLKGKVAATSWGRRLLCGEVEPQRLEEFVELYVDDAPEGGARP